MKINPLMATDFYKVGHIKMYAKGTSLVYSNLTPRGDKLAKVLPDFDHKVVFFGLQAFVKWFLIDAWDEEFFQKPKDEVVSEYKRRMDMSLGEGAVDVAHIAALHDLGYLPLKIKALPEGSRVNMKVPVLTIQNTHPEFFWLTNYLESCLSTEMWKPINSATTAYEYHRLLKRYAELTGSPNEFVPWQGHDFSFRGMSTIHDGASSGAAHLLSFTGTDTISAIDYLEQFYHGKHTFVGGSVPASEHSVTSLGILNVNEQSDEYKAAATLFSDNDPKLIGEYLFIKNLITEVFPSGVISLVSDTFDFFRTISEIAPALKQEIMSRQRNALGLAKIVWRPDSGNPVKVIVGDPEAPEGTPEHLGAVETLWNTFGGTITETGHKLLDANVGLIYGDSITLERAFAILQGLHEKGFASANVVFGIGSYTYQHATRDSFGFAVKATYSIVNEEPLEIYKDPATDVGSLKKSARGLLRVEFDGTDFVLHDRQTIEQERLGLLETVFLDGKLIRDESLATIRKRLGAI